MYLVDVLVYEVSLPLSATSEDFEYYIQVEVENESLVFPVTVPNQYQTVIVF